MKINDDFLVGLKILRERMGVPEKTDTYGQPMEPFEEIEARLGTTEGIEVEIEDIQRVGPFLTYRGETLAILYIQNSGSSSEELLNNSAETTRDNRTPKFHLTWCKTLDKMRQVGRFERYVLSRSKSNRFKVEALEGDGKRHMLDNIQLFPCRYCLDSLNYRGFSISGMLEPEKLGHVESFSVKEYLEENDGNLAVMKHLPSTLEHEARPGDYTPEFLEISNWLRREKRQICSSCGVDMSRKKEGLHVHHVNGVRSDNRPFNLMVLCALCHQEIDEFHRTMHVPTDIRNFILRNRP